MAASASSITEFDANLERHMRALCEPPKDASQGIFYPLKYFESLGEQPRTDWFRNRGKFYNGHASASHWELATLAGGRKMGPTNHHQYFFVLKDGLKPCDALDILKKGPTLLDCMAVAHIALYSALRDQLGDEKFNAVFRRGGPAPLALDRFGSVSSFWLEETKDIGQVRHLLGAPKYEVRHVGGSAGGMATVVVGDKRLAFGLPEESSEREVLQHLADENNKPGSADGLYDAHEAWPHLTQQHATGLMICLCHAFVDKYEDTFLRKMWSPERKSEATVAEITRIATEDARVTVEDLERINRTQATNTRVREDCLQELEAASLDRVDDVVKRWLPTEPRIPVNYSASPPVVALGGVAL